METLQRSGGLVPDQIRTGGGGAASNRWSQIRADVFGRPLVRVKGSDPGAMGAAILAGVGSGAMADLATAAQRLVQSDHVFLPDPRRTAKAEARFALWQDLIKAARRVNARLAGS